MSCANFYHPAMSPLILARTLATPRSHRSRPPAKRAASSLSSPIPTSSHPPANATLNPEKTRIIPLMFAASPEDASLEFHYSDSGFCNGGSLRASASGSTSMPLRCKCRGRNVHALLKQSYPELIPKIRFVKIDTEGLRAVRPRISPRLDHPDQAVYENRGLHAPEPRATLAPCNRSITSLGYTIRRNR